MIKPKINRIIPDIQKVSIYLRSTKKFGKTTLFRDVVLEKFKDPSRGLLVGCGNEVGYKMLDNLNYVQVTSWRDVEELCDWLIDEKGKEHNIELVAFDTVDELVLLAELETVRRYNVDCEKSGKADKKARTIKAAFGGYTAGEKYAANELIKPTFNQLQRAGFGVWAIAHTKFKSIKEKGSLDEDGYMQLTSNLIADYESAFGDILDITVTGIVDRTFDTVESDGKQAKPSKKYVNDEVRKLYFRGTTLIDAGGRFADGAVPEYMTFDKRNMAKEFISIIENGMEKSKLEYAENKPELVTETTTPTEEVEEVVEQKVSITKLRKQCTTKYKALDKDSSAKAKVFAYVKDRGNFTDLDYDELLEVNAMLEGGEEE